MTFKAVIHPESGGCYSQGETVEELLANLREAALGCLEVLRAEGRSPEPEVEVADLAV
jgi:predicted RNase H-like HicB family nuclease